jgi:hypothetical protein
MPVVWIFDRSITVGSRAEVEEDDDGLRVGVTVVSSAYRAELGVIKRVIEHVVLLADIDSSGIESPF